MSGRPSTLRRRRALWRAALAFGCLALVGVAGAGMSGASTSQTPTLQVRAIDATAPKTVSVDVMYGGGAKPSALQVLTGDQPVSRVTTTKLSAAGVMSDVVVVLDNSAAVGNGPVQIAKEALSKFAPGSHSIDSLGVVATGGSATPVATMSGSIDDVASSIQNIGPNGTSMLWDGIARAADMLTTDATSQRNIVVVTGTPDAGSSVALSQLRDVLEADQISLHVVALAGGQPDLGSLGQLESIRGGTFQTGNSNELSAMFANVAGTISSQYRLTFPTPTKSSATDLVPLTINWGDATTAAAYRPGTAAVGLDDLRPLTENSGFASGFFSSSFMKWIVVLLGTAAAGTAVFAVGGLVLRDKDGLDYQLRHYDGYVEEIYSGDEEMVVAKSQILKRAVDITGHFADRGGILVRVENLLERADIPLRPAEAIFVYVAIAVLSVIAAIVVLGSPLMAAGAAIIAVILPNQIVSFRGKRRKKKFVAQLPDMLQLLSGTLRAGYSISQGFEAVSKEVDGPMGRELRRIMTEARLGRPLEDALDASADRMDSDDFRWAVMAIRIQREVGGNLAELLLTVADTMTQRERLRRDVAGLTAEGRMSAIVLGCLPPGLAVVMWVMNPDYIGRLFQDGIGIGLLVIAGIAMLIGFAWMKKIITIEI